MKQNKVPKNEYIRKPSGKKNPYKDDVLYTPNGQWDYPGQVTRIPSGDITMQGVPYPVYGEDDLGNSQMMYPGMDYQFPGQYVTEYPQIAKNGGGLLNKTLTCPSCGWSWKAVDGGTDITTCHKCGSTVKLAYGGLPKAQKGKQKGNAISDWWYNTDDVQSTYNMAPDVDPFLVNWLQHPETQKRLSENLKSSILTNDINPKTLTKQSINKLSALPMFSRELVKKAGVSKSDIEYNNSLQGWKTPISILNNPYDSGHDPLELGVYMPDYHVSMVNTFKDPGVIAHEQTHAAGPLQKAMEDVIFTNYFNKKKDPDKRFIEEFGEYTYDDKYNRVYEPLDKVKERYPGIYREHKERQKYLDEDGLYPRIMDIRRTLNLKPGQKVNKSILSNDSIYSPLLDLRNYYDDDTIIDMLNTLAKNNTNQETNEAAYGGDPSLPNITGHYQDGGMYADYNDYLKAKEAYSDSLNLYNKYTNPVAKLLYQYPFVKLSELKNKPKNNKVIVDKYQMGEDKGTFFLTGKVDNYAKLENKKNKPIGYRNVKDVIDDVGESYPVYKKPVVKPELAPDYLPMIQAAMPEMVSREPEIITSPTPRPSSTNNRISWTMDPETRKMVPVYLEGKTQKVKEGKRLYNKYIPSSTAAIPADFVPQFEPDKNKDVVSKKMGGWLDQYQTRGEVKSYRPTAESTFVKKPQVKVSPDFKNLNKYYGDDPSSKYDYGYVKDLLKKYNVSVDSTGNVLDDLGLPSKAYYNPLTRTIHYKHNPKRAGIHEYTEMVMKELPHAIQADSLGELPFLKNVFVEGIADLFNNNSDSRYDDVSKIEGHAHNTLEKKLYKQLYAKKTDDAVKRYRRLLDKSDDTELNEYPFGGRFTKTHTHMDNGGSNVVKPLNLKKYQALPETSGMKYTKYPSLDTLKKEQAARLKNIRKPTAEEVKLYAKPDSNVIRPESAGYITKGSPEIIGKAIPHKIAAHNRAVAESSTPDILQERKEQPAGDKIIDVILNPFTAATNLYQHGYLPDYFTQGPKNINDIPAQIAFSYTNPGKVLSMAKASTKLVPDVAKIVKDPTAGRNYLNVADDILSMAHVASLTKQVPGFVKAINDFKKKELGLLPGGLSVNVGNIKKLYSNENKIEKGLDRPHPFQYGGWLDEYTDEYKRGGSLYTPPGLKKKVRQKGTSKNIVSSINKLFTRNYDLFGPSGKAIYNPKSKYQSGGGWLDNLE